MSPAMRRLWALKLAVESMPTAGHQGTTQVFLDRANCFVEFLNAAPGSERDEEGDMPPLSDRPVKRRRG